MFNFSFFENWNNNNCNSLPIDLVCLREQIQKFNFFACLLDKDKSTNDLSS